MPRDYNVLLFFCAFLSIVNYCKNENKANRRAGKFGHFVKTRIYFLL